MKRKTTRGFSLLIAVLLAVSLLPMTALASDQETKIYTSPDGLGTGQYYFDMDPLYDFLFQKRYSEKMSSEATSEEAEAYAAEHAPHDLAAFQAASWYLDKDTLALRVDFPSGYDPSAIFSADDPDCRQEMLELLRVKGIDSFDWVDVPIQQADASESYEHFQYYLNVDKAFELYKKEAQDYVDAHPEEFEDVYIDEYVHQSAMWRLEKIRHTLEDDVESVYYVCEDDPLFRVKKVTTSPGGTTVEYYPFAARQKGVDDDSQFVMEYHDYLDECSWKWVDEDHVTATFVCYIGEKDGSNDTVVFELTGSDIEKKIIREPTELTDGEMECTATVTFPDSVTFLDVTYTDTHTFFLPATGNPERLAVTVQPEDKTLRYPEGATFHVEVDKPERAVSYQWYDTDALGRPVKLDGLTATTATLELPATQAYVPEYDLFCEITDVNGNKTISNTAHVTVENTDEHKPVFYVGDYALEPGDTLALSETALGSGVVSYDKNGHEVTLENVMIDVDSKHLLFDTISSPGTGLFAACSGCVFEDGEFYVHVKGDCVINSNYYDAAHYSGGIVINAHFKASDVDTDTIMILDGDGKLELNGGITAINTDSALELNVDLKTCNNEKNYGKGIYTGGILYIDEGVDVDIKSFGPGLFAESDLHISDGATVKIDATAPHVFSRNTEMYAIVSNGNMHCGEAAITINVHAIQETMFPYNGTIANMTGITSYDLDLDGTRLSITIDAETADGQLYAGKVYGIQGESLQGVYLADGAKVDIRIDTDIVRDIIAGIAAGGLGGVTLESGCELNIAVRGSSPVVGIDVTKPVRVTDAVMNINAESTTGDYVFGVLCPETNIELNNCRDSVMIKAKDGVAIFANDDNEGTDFDPDYTPTLILVSGKGKITTPVNGVVNRYGFPFFGSLVPGESIYDPDLPAAPAAEVSVTANGFNCPSAPFKDVDIDQWYHKSIDYVIEKGLMNGVASDRFDPDGTTTRAMVVTILYRLEGKPAISGANPFDDVAADQWYTDAVVWANGNGIVNGYGNGKFGPTDDITREQFAAILYRYAQFKGYNVNIGQDTNILSYDDAGEISDWAMEAIQWAVGASLIQGRTKSTIAPAGNATRAEAATILMRFAEL